MALLLLPVFLFITQVAFIPVKSWLGSSLANKYRTLPGPHAIFFPPREYPGIKVNEICIFLSQCQLLSGLLGGQWLLPRLI